MVEGLCCRALEMFLDSKSLAVTQFSTGEWWRAGEDELCL